MSEINIEEQTKQLIDRLKATCKEYGLSNTGNEYLIITDIFLYKYMNDLFGHEAKMVNDRLGHAELWDVEYDKFTKEEEDDLFTYLSAGTPLLRHDHTLAHLVNASQRPDFADIFDATLIAIGDLNADVFSMTTAGDKRFTIFHRLTHFVTDPDRQNQFASALVSHLATFDFDSILGEKYDFFSTIFEYLIKDYNTNGGGTYAEYYTPKSVATIMARMLVPSNADIRSVTCYDPAAGTGTLLMALAHRIGEDRCQIYSQDISQKSSQMLRLNLILNHLVGSIQNIVEGDTLTTPYHKKGNELKTFDYIVSNPPFNTDFSGTRDAVAAQTKRFWAGVPKIPNKKLEDMEIYLCFLQHAINSLNKDGKAAIVVPTGFLSAGNNKIAQRIHQLIVDEGWLRGVVSMPSSIFANTGTNVSVIFIDKTHKGKDVILMDASKLGDKIKVDGKQRILVSQKDIDKIIDTFISKKAEDGFSVVVTAEQIKEKKYSFSAGKYFDIKIDYKEITACEFEKRITKFKQTLSEQFQNSHLLEKEIMGQFNTLKINN